VHMTQLLAFALALALGQQSTPLSGVVTDSTGAVVAGALVTVSFDDTRQEVLSGGDGSWTTSVPAGQTSVGVRVAARGFASADRAGTLPAESLRVQLRPQAIAESVTGSADTTAVRLSIESSVTSLDRSAIAEAPALRLDDQLRSVPGFSLFRRTTSAVANPTTQGVTLRGLSASGASRTLVVADDVPLNDPFGAWVYWDRVPVVALQRVDVMRGASGDIHGNDALGGVIRLTTRTTRGAEGWLDGGSLGSVRGSGYGALSRSTWMAGVSAESMKTDGFVVVAPEARGSIDVPADSSSTSAMGWAGGTRGSFQATLRGGYFTEDRGNGTPAQVNATITRWTGANAHGLLAGGVWDARGDVSTNNYRQTFSAATGTVRGGERLTALQWVHSTGTGAGVNWLRQISRGQVLIGAAGRAARADLDEASFSLTGVLAPTVRTQPRQHGYGAVFQGRFDLSPRATVEAGARIDRWTLSKVGQISPASDFTFFEPRVGLSFRASSDSALRLSWLSGFRTPTMNELYRSFRVGNTTTNANANLKPEKSSGPEVAFTMQRERWTGRAIVYATRLSGAIYNRTISSTQTAIVRERANGDARAVGSELELEWRASRKLTLTTAWALSDSKFTSGELDGKRTPQVPRVGGSIGARANAGAFSAALNVRVVGAQFDDDINTLELRKASLVDGRAGWRFSRRLELFGAIENAMDREVDTGKTPLRTVGAPRMARAGMTVRF
jgi:outer membrane receptor protein involved in Fe transport